MKKVSFLKKLRTELEISKVNEIDEVINYYDELIEDEKESGKSEEDIVKGLDINKIVLELRQEKFLEAAKMKPSISNNLKVIIVTLLVISSPFLIPLVIILLTFIFVAIILGACLLLVLGCLVFAGAAWIIGLFIGLIIGEVSFLSFVLILGISFVSIGIGLILFKLTLKALFHITRSLANKVISKSKKRKVVNQND